MKSRAAYQREWRKLNPGKTSEYCKKYKDKNYDLVLQSMKSWRDRNREYIKEYNANWVKNNLDKYRVYNHNRRARLKQISGIYTLQDILDLLEKQNYLCNGCKSQLVEYEIDHIIPISRNGTNWPDNLQILCPHCNAEKHDKTMEEWLKSKKE